MARSDFGKKGGSSATAGKRAELIVDACGVRKRVFHGQRWLLVQQRSEADRPLVRAYQSEEDATRQMLLDRRHADDEVEYVSLASPTAA